MADQGLKPKDLIGAPWRVALALQADGWWLRSDIIWRKPNPMPESVRDRPTKAHEYIFLLSKSKQYYYDADAIAEDGNKKEIEYRKRLRADAKYNMKAPYKKNFPDGGRLDGKRNKRTVWSISTRSYSGAHFATFPPELPELCIKAGSRPGDLVLDPFGGSGTTGMVANQLGRRSVLLDISMDYIGLMRERCGITAMQAWESGKAAVQDDYGPLFNLTPAPPRT